MKPTTFLKVRVEALELERRIEEYERSGYVVLHAVPASFIKLNEQASEVRDYWLVIKPKEQQ